ncbi:thioredoxin [Patiriisocius marinus]|uniref:Thioredoxin n=1 Tax=Patiriisocius marinus TaxID=1397112 RepID=A0A5J4IRF8_9FLAO|nr:thioredoxin [Patiriisocius marinus]
MVFNPFWGIVISILLLASCTSTSKKETVSSNKHTNLLAQETSPYLLQHAHNPVDWRAWNDVSLEKAKEEKKLIVISVGYAACHWCHVMERESFEDTTVAAVMNKNFINIKVDREERPDVDQIYINAVQLLTGNAGWPLNVVALPDGRPIWGGTYFRKDEWINALERLQQLYETEPQKLLDVADNLEEGIKSMDLLPLNTDDVDFKEISIDETIASWKESFDPLYGGTKRAPKFMMPDNVSFLLRQAIQNNDNKLLEQVTLTLDRMAYGGIYDHVAGGFSRYSTDIKWHVPHFEKMLYDNGQLVSLYSDAYKATKKELYKEVVEETLRFIAAEFTTDNGAFYSSYDADSDNENGELEEGAFYVFAKEELKTLIGNDFNLFSDYYNVNTFGKWEADHYVLIRSKSDEEIIDTYNISAEILNSKKTLWKKALSEYRSKRPMPRLDDKILTSWNGLMLKGYVDAYKAFGTEDYLDAAVKNAHFIKNNQMQTSGALLHNHKNGKSTINGYLEDYAAVIDAYISLYEVTLDMEWLDIANNLTAYTFEHFFDEKKKLFYFTSDEDPALVTRNFEYRDNVIPASNSIMAKNLQLLSHYFDNQLYAEVSKQMLKNVLPEMKQYPSGFSNWLSLLLDYQKPFYEVVVVGANAKEKLAKININYLPNILTAGSNIEASAPLLTQRYVDNQTLIYVCVNNACKLPESVIEKAINPIKLTK